MTSVSINTISLLNTGFLGIGHSTGGTYVLMSGEKSVKRRLVRPMLVDLTAFSSFPTTLIDLLFIVANFDTVLGIWIVPIHVYCIQLVLCYIINHSLYLPRNAIRVPGVGIAPPRL